MNGKRAPALLLLLLLLAFAAPSALAEEPGPPPTPLRDFVYTLDEDTETVLLTKYIGEDTSVYVPGSFALDGREYAAVVASTTVFRGNTSIKSAKIGSGVRFSADSMRLLFGECSALTDVDLSEADSTGVTNMSYVFYQCSALQSLDLSSLDTAAVKTMRGMFSMCAKLKSLTGYEDWDTSAVQDMYQTFNRVGYSYGAGAPDCIDLSRWDLSGVRNTGWCFQNCRAKEILLPDSLAVMSAGFLNHATNIRGAVFTIPAGVKKIGYAHTIYDFSNDGFVAFEVAEGNTAYRAIDGILYSADGSEMLAVPRGKVFENDTYEVPEGVTFLGELSFSRNYNLHTLLLPDSYEICYVPLYDERYILEGDTGNLNAGTNLSIAIYCYTGVTEYAVKETNPRYASRNGVIYSRDFTHLVAVPARYGQPLSLPQGVTHWDREAMWADGSSTVDNLLSGCSGVSIPASLVSISDDQFDMLNRLHAGRASGSNPFTISVEEGNRAFAIREDGSLLRLPPIVITQEPADVSVPLGETASTSVSAVGEGLRYQWYGQDPGGSVFTSSLKGDTYSVALIRSKVGRRVWCVITDKDGNTVTTRTATLGMELPEGYAAPSITVQPQDATAAPGEIVRIPFTAEGTELSYQWYIRNQGSETWSRSSITGDTYSVEMNASRNGRELYCVVTDKYGAVARTETVTIGYDYPENYKAPEIKVQPTDAFADLGEPAETSFVAEGTELRYQWYLRDSETAPWSRSSLTGSTYSVAMVPAKSGRQVKCVVTDKYGAKTETDVVTLTLQIPAEYAEGPKIVQPPEDWCGPRGALAGTTVVAVGADLTYQWYGIEPDGRTFKSSLRGSTYSVTMVPAKSGRQVWCVITDKYGRTAATEPVVLTMEP